MSYPVAPGTLFHTTVIEVVNGTALRFAGTLGSLGSVDFVIFELQTPGSPSFLERTRKV